MTHIRILIKGGIRAVVETLIDPWDWTELSVTPLMLSMAYRYHHISNLKSHAALRGPPDQSGRPDEREEPFSFLSFSPRPLAA